MGTDMRSIKGHKGDIRKMSFLRDEKLLLTASCDSTIKVWQLAPHEEALEAEQVEVDDLLADISLESSTNLSSLDTSPVLVSKDKDVLVTTVRVHDFDVASMALHPSHKLLATSAANNCVRVWDLSDLDKVSLLHEFVGHRGAVNSVNWIRGESAFVSASQDYDMFLYDTQSSRRLAGFGFEGSILCTAVLPNQNVILAGGNHYDIKGYR